MPPVEFLGRLHPLLVHLPIGILMFAAGLMIWGSFKKQNLEPAIALAWGLGAFSALLACGAGWLLAQSGEYDAALVQKHQWMGLLTAGLSAVTFFFKQYRWIPATVTLLALMVAGHYGGNLTHGEDYLFPSEKQQANVKSVPMNTDKFVVSRTDSIQPQNGPLVRRTFFYRDQVVPVLKAKCYSCHSVSKKKGGLRLDTEEFIRQGGKHGAILTAGIPSKSKLFTYLLLPEGDEQHMPPKGKLQLSPKELAVIHHWIQKGASFKEEVEVIQPKNGVQIVPVAEVVPTLPMSLKTDSLATESTKSAPEEASVEASILAKGVGLPDQIVLDKLKQQQVTLTKLADGTPYLTANFVNVKDFSPELLEDLMALRQQIVRLRLANQPVTDADVKRITAFKNLTRLNLENTRITDTALATLSTLPNLEQLNLYGTIVTDAGLDALSACPNLKVLYLWQTQTTPVGIQRLQKARPNLKIEAGTRQLAKSDTNKPMKPM